MTIPRVVVFDLGKVLLDFDYGIAVRKIQQRCRISLAELHQLINQSPLLLRYECSQMDTAQFFNEIQAASGFCGSLEDFRGLFADIFTPIPLMVQLHADLRRAGVPTYIFSNTNEIAIGHIRRQFPFFANFDGYILSYEHGTMKPDPKFYDIAERIIAHAGPDLLYIDDRPENIETGRLRHWRAILHQDPVTTRAAVADSGLPIQPT